MTKCARVEAWVLLAALALASCSSSRSAGSGGTDGVHGTDSVDPFGVRRIYPTTAGGREWYLPAKAEVESDEWKPSDGSRGRVMATSQPGVFHVEGSPRFPVVSPAGKAWWRNVEITGYFRYLATRSIDRERPGWQIFARSERHTQHETIDSSTVNYGVRPPPGTAVWPGYPFPSGQLNAHCVATSMKGFVQVDGAVRFKKEISHNAGYTDARAEVHPFSDGGSVPQNAWFGVKVVIRNFNANRFVHMEIWTDLPGDGTWRKVTQTDDTGNWRATDARIDGCTAAPFRYSPAQLITWAGPWAFFRFDDVSCDIKWFSIREIDPLP